MNTLAAYKIIHGRLITNFPSESKCPIISKKVNAEMTPKKVVNSLLRTVLDEKGFAGTFQSLNLGKNAGVTSAHFINEEPNLFLKNSSSAKMIRS